MDNKIKAVIFDMDGTALDSMGKGCENVLELLEQLNLDHMCDKAEQLKDLGWSISAKHINDAYGTDFCEKAIRDGYTETHYGNYRNSYELMPGFAEFLDYLDSKDIKYAIATATRLHGAEDVFRRFNLIDRLEFITTEGRVGKTKDFPDIYLDASERLGADISNTIVFEDALYAVKTAKDAGFKTIALREPFYESDHEEINAVADLFIEDFNDLLAQINNGYKL